MLVAGVAGLAALGVIVAQDLVGAGAERVETTSARQTAARLAADTVKAEWMAETPKDQKEADRINEHHSGKCARLGIIYSDVFNPAQPDEGVRYRAGSLDEDAGEGWGPDDKHYPSCWLLMMRD